MGLIMTVDLESLDYKPRYYSASTHHESFFLLIVTPRTSSRNMFSYLALATRTISSEISTHFALATHVNLKHIIWGNKLKR